MLNDMSKCLFCYKELEQGQTDFHPVCSMKIFGRKHTPALQYTRSQIKVLAEKVIRSQTAVTGVQAKLSLDFANKKSERLTIVGLWGRFILKPQTDLYPNLPELEDVTMHLAEIAGIEVVPHSLMRFQDGELCYITRRIDRKKDGSKIAMEDMCQLSERLTEYKYKGSYEQIAKLILKYSAAPVLDMEKFWEVVAFSWITGNSDMHLKNFSLFSPLHDEYILTPAYDLLSTLLVMPSDTEELALTICGKKSRLKKADFKSAITSSGIADNVCSNILSKFFHVRDQWIDFINNSFLPTDMKSQYIQLINQRLELLQ